MKQTTTKNGPALLGTMILAVTLLCASANLSTAGTAGVDCRMELDRAVLPAGDAQNVVVKVTLDAPEPPEKIKRPPVNLSIVLDRSGSMHGPKLEKAKEAAIEALRRLSPEDIFSLVMYDHAVRTIVPAQSARNAEWIASRIRNIQSGGNTALFGGVSQGAAEIRKHLSNRYVHRIILLSDGLANVGPSSPEDLGRLGAALIKEGISVTTVGVGTDYNEDLMTRLSQKSDGNTYFVESSMDLPRIFTAELGDVLNVVAKKVHLIIECPRGVTPVRIIGRDGRIKGRTVELSLNQLYGGQEKFALLEVNVPSGKNGKKMRIADARVIYENPYTQKSETSKGMATAVFSNNEKRVEASTNVGVQRDIHLNYKAEAEEKAIQEYDQGNSAGAVKSLKGSARSLRDFANKYNDAEVMKEAEQMEEQAEKLKQKGMTKRTRKKLRTDSYQMKNQQMRK